MKKSSDIPIQFIKGVGPAKAKLLANLGIETVEDLLYLFPRRYDDRTRLTPIKNIKAGEWHTVAGKVLVGGGRKTWFTKKHVFETAVGDESGRIFCVWFNQPYLEKYLTIEQEVVLYGKVDVFKNRLQMVSPEYELIAPQDRSLSMGRIVPIYPLTKGISQRYLRRLIDACLNTHESHLLDLLPDEVRRSQKLEPLAKSIRQLHFPSTPAAQEKAMARIAFEEFFLFQISVILRRLSIVGKTGVPHRIEDPFIRDFVGGLPFTLTAAQQKALQEIILDMSKAQPMLRLIQGDVGSGKTVLAFFGCAAAWRNGHQAAILAPTEILAQQHYANLQKFLEQGAFAKWRVALLINSLSKKEKEAVYAGLKDGTIHAVIGTHALLQETVAFKDLSFVAIDEQHKFGVQQRALLSAKAQLPPDVLIMTATPIPRTLCLTLYGDLDISLLNERPPGRGKVATYHFPTEKSPSVYEQVRQWVKKGTQAYIVYPIIEESETLDLKAAKDMFTHFRQFEFADLRVALVHGQMERGQLEVVMRQFKNHELDILVATTILEVGIDVANANVMVIEHAERFGLSQLHQMRGRIGRGPKDAVCILISDPTTEEAKARLQAIIQTTDGFKIAEHDLKIRGPGHYFGRHQHGLNELRVANPVTQMAVLEQARKEAVALTHTDPQLKAPQHRLVKATIQKRYPQYLEMVWAG